MLAHEIVFLVEEDPDGGLTARSLGESIFTEAFGPTSSVARVQVAADA